MEVPKDYVLDIVRQALDDKIEAAVKNLTNEINNTRTDIADIKSEFRGFRNICKNDMDLVNNKITNHENAHEPYKEFKYKVYAYSGAIAVASGVAAKFILST